MKKTKTLRSRKERKDKKQRIRKRKTMKGGLITKGYLQMIDQLNKDRDKIDHLDTNNKNEVQKFIRNCRHQKIIFGQQHGDVYFKRIMHYLFLTTNESNKKEVVLMRKLFDGLALYLDSDEHTNGNDKNRERRVLLSIQDNLKKIVQFKIHILCMEWGIRNIEWNLKTEEMEICLEEIILIFEYVFPSGGEDFERYLNEGFNILSNVAEKSLLIEELDIIKVEIDILYEYIYPQISTFESKGIIDICETLNKLLNKNAQTPADQDYTNLN
jgi:hypothetical protein